MSSNVRPPIGTNFWVGGLEILLSFIILFLCVGSMPPGINESHYLPKAKHVWDTSFAGGNDLFLQSNDSHFLASLMAGILARWFELSVVAWICRAIAWLLFSVAWSRYCRVVGLPTLLRPLVLVGWLLLVRYGHLAGEWLVGGFEAKSLAYPVALLGLASAIENRWLATWLWLGAATAFHPVVGGWVGISVAVVWVLLPINIDQRLAQGKALFGGFLLALIGVGPALMGLGSPDREGPISAAQVHVYFRLAHHLCPRTFQEERWFAAGIVVLSFIVLALLSLWKLRVFTEARSEGVNLRRQAQAALNTPLGKLLGIAIVSILISCIGWTIDRVGVRTGREDLAAQLLRFYWFRWSDVAVPLATSTLSGLWLMQLCFVPGGRTTKEVTPAGSYLLMAAMLGTSVLGYWHWRNESSSPVPPADRWMIQQTGPFPVRWNQAPNAYQGELPKRYVDWQAVCEWSKKNSPTDSLWITPKHQHSFKWYSHRAEVVSWKDVPQDNRSIIEWYRRIGTLTPPQDHRGRIRGWTTAEFISLAQEFRCNWILIDRTYQEEPPLLECKYPINIDNRSFAVYYVSDAVLNRTAEEKN